MTHWLKRKQKLPSLVDYKSHVVHFDLVSANEKRQARINSRNVIKDLDSDILAMSPAVWHQTT